MERQRRLSLNLYLAGLVTIILATSQQPWYMWALGALGGFLCYMSGNLAGKSSQLDGGK